MSICDAHLIRQVLASVNIYLSHAVALSGAGGPPRPGAELAPSRVQTAVTFRWSDSVTGVVGYAVVLLLLLTEYSTFGAIQDDIR